MTTSWMHHHLMRICYNLNDRQLWWTAAAHLRASKRRATATRWDSRQVKNWKFFFFLKVRLEQAFVSFGTEGKKLKKDTTYEFTNLENYLLVCASPRGVTITLPQHIKSRTWLEKTDYHRKTHSFVFSLIWHSGEKRSAKQRGQPFAAHKNPRYRIQPNFRNRQ